MVGGSLWVPVPAPAAESTSSDEANSSESTPGSLNHALTLVTDMPNRWCVDGQYQVYSDAKFLNDKGVMTRILTLERRVLTKPPDDARDPQSLHQTSDGVDNTFVGTL